MAKEGIGQNIEKETGEGIIPMPFDQNSEVIPTPEINGYFF